MVLTGSFVVSLETGLIVSITCGDDLKLDTSVGVSGRHDFAVHDERIRLVRHRVHRIPRPTFVTIAKRPSERAQDARRSARDLPVVTSELACDRLTRRANQLTRTNCSQTQSSRVPDALRHKMPLRRAGTHVEMMS
jgi:hypothetical protein